MAKKVLTTVICTLALVLWGSPDYATGQSYRWIPLEGEGTPQARHENALVRAGDQFILLGGRGMKTMDIYNTGTGEWSHGAQPPFEIHHIQAVTVDGLVYVVGALSGGWPHETPLPNILIYDPVVDRWAIGPEIPQDRRRGASGTVVYQDKIYIVCGIIDGHSSGWVNWLDEFDPATNKWTVLPDAPRSRDHLHSAVSGDRLYVAGGRKSGYQGQGFEATVKETDVYDFTTGEWRELPSPEGDIPTERAGTAAAVHNGNLLIIGGESGSQQAAHSEVEMLDTATETWSTLDPLIRGRHGTQAISFDNIVVIGAGSGNRGGGPELTSFEILADNETPELSFEPLTPSRLTVSSDKIHFSNNGTEELILRSQDGNKATLISYIQLDNSNGYELNVAVEAPFVLSPGQQLPIEISWNGSGETAQQSEATLLIKELGGSEPLRVRLSAGD